MRISDWISYVFSSDLFLAAPYGLFAVGWAYVARVYLTLPLQVILLKRASGIGFGRTWAAIWEPLAASAVMGIALHYGLPAAARLTANPWLCLTAASAAGTSIYGCALTMGTQARTGIVRENS